MFVCVPYLAPSSTSTSPLPPSLPSFSPCMLDALVMGHVKALKNTELPVNPLHAVVDTHFHPNAGLGAAF